MQEQTYQSPNSNQDQSPSALASSPQSSSGSRGSFYLFGAIIAALLILVGFLLYQNTQLQRNVLAAQNESAANQQSNITTTKAPTVQPTETMEKATNQADGQEALENWENYTGPNYSFDHPQGLTSSTTSGGEGSESIRFGFMGQKQIDSGRTQTELWDGYFFTVIKLGLDSEKTADLWATERRNGVVEGGRCFQGTISELKSVAINGASGVEFSGVNCATDFTTSYVEFGNIVYEITQIYVGEEADQAEYQKITDQIFNSLTFY